MNGFPLVSGLLAFTAFLSASTGPIDVTLLISDNSSLAAGQVTLIASVSSSSATGTVTFYDGIRVIGSAQLRSGKASLTTMLRSSRTRSVAAYYAGDENNLAGF